MVLVVLVGALSCVRGSFASSSFSPPPPVPCTPDAAGVRDLGVEPCLPGQGWAVLGLLIVLLSPAFALELLEVLELTVLLVVVPSSKEGRGEGPLRGWRVIFSHQREPASLDYTGDNLLRDDFLVPSLPSWTRGLWRDYRRGQVWGMSPMKALRSSIESDV